MFPKASWEILHPSNRVNNYSAEIKFPPITWHIETVFLLQGSIAFTREISDLSHAT